MPSLDVMLRHTSIDGTLHSPPKPEQEQVSTASFTVMNDYPKEENIQYSN